MASNQAAWITGKKAVPLKVSEAPVPKPAADEIIIDNKAVAINPVDWKIQVGYQSWSTRSKTDVVHSMGAFTLRTSQISSARTPPERSLRSAPMSRTSRRATVSLRKLCLKR